MNGLVTTPQGVFLELRVVPGASRNELKIETDGSVKVRLQAPAVEGKANKALLKFMAQRLGLRPRDVTLVSGDKSRCKRVLITQKNAQEIAAALSV